MALNSNNMFLFESEKRDWNDEIKPCVIHLLRKFVIQKLSIKCYLPSPVYSKYTLLHVDKGLQCISEQRSL